MPKTKAPLVQKQILVDCDMTIEQWAAKHGHPRGWYWDLRKRKCAPDVIEGRISQAADRRWEKKMLRLGKQAKARREAERRSAMAAMAGKIAAKSPRHPSKKPRHDNGR
jgi:hypothetical protein